MSFKEKDLTELGCEWHELLLIPFHCSTMDDIEWGYVVVYWVYEAVSRDQRREGSAGLVLGRTPSTILVPSTAPTTEWDIKCCKQTTPVWEDCGFSDIRLYKMQEKWLQGWVLVGGKPFNFFYFLFFFLTLLMVLAVFWVYAVRIHLPSLTSAFNHSWKEEIWGCECSEKCLILFVVCLWLISGA